MNFSAFSEMDRPWITNLNKNLGFSIAYPRGLKTNPQFTKTYLLTDKWSQTSQKPGNPILEILLTPKQNYSCGYLGQCYYFSSVRIGMSQTPDALENCQKIPEGATASGEENISGIKFITYQTDDRAMMQYATIQTFAAVHDNACYNIEFIETGSDSKDTVPAHWRTDNQILAQHIIQSFIFLDTLALPANK